jgi:aminopeptidase N
MMIKFKKVSLLFIVLILSLNVFSQKQTRASITRSDSVDITHTTLLINNLDFVNKQINALAVLDIKSKVNNLGSIQLDLENFIVDSVLINNSNALFNYNNAILSITTNVLNINDSAQLKIYYHGAPTADPSWGGFYYQGVYAFSMGVGFTAQPHSVGRYLFPCFDNFVERCPFEFYITTDANNMGTCNGIFQDSVTQNNGDIIWHWKLEQSIPSYLVSVAVAPYVWVKQNIAGINGSTPVWIACLLADTNKVKGSFANLQKSFNMLEQHFGVHSWPKVGFSLVPFNNGAMEHATNIHIGVAFIDGTLSYETLIAHELSHHWFGDLVTCKTAQDMWLNEGFASYCEMLHNEFVYGKSTYYTDYIANHYNILNSAHINDKGYRAISNMDSNHTYGITVYSKGADVLHTLRSYLGDSLFFNGIKYYCNKNAFKDATTNTLQQDLTSYTGKNLSYFFNDWVHQPGCANFCIDSVKTTINGNQYHVIVGVRQRKQKNSNYFTDVPLPITFYKNDFTKETKNIILTGRCDRVGFDLNYEPAFVCLDEENALSDASTFDTKRIKTSGTINFNNAKAILLVKSVVNSADSALVRIEHHWVAPDRFKIPNSDYVLNDQRYWRVDGINLQNIKGLLRFSYSGLATNQYLDSTWLKNTEDNIRLFYRKDATQNWSLANDSIAPVVLTDKQGAGFIKEIIAGEYAFGIKRPGYIDPLVSDAPNGPCGWPDAITDNVNSIKFLDISPNPSSGAFIITNKTTIQELEIVISNLDGAKVDNFKLNKNYQVKIKIPGTYLITAYFNDKIIGTEKIIVE